MVPQDSAELKSRYRTLGNLAPLMAPTTPKADSIC